MRRALHVLLVVAIGVAVVACQGAVDDDTARRARERLTSNIDSTRATSATLIQQLDTVPNVQFSRGLAGALGTTYGSFGSVVRDLRVPDAALRELRGLQSAAGAVQTYGNRAGKATTQEEFALLVAAAKQKIAEFDVAAALLVAKLDEIIND